MHQTTLAALLLLVVAQLAQPYILGPKRASELFGKRSSELFGKRASELFGKRSPQRSLSSILEENPDAELIGKRSMYDDYNSVALTPDMLDALMDRFEMQRARRASELFGR